MPVQSIRLPKGEWQFDDNDRLGPSGGFGEVFRGRGPTGEVAIKRLKVEAGHAAHRELRIGEELLRRNIPHVVPILDAGRDAQSDRYYLVIPVCDGSLQDRIAAASGPLDLSTSLSAIRAIIAGLESVPDITHRDLKPGNVLWHDGKWKIADFGIAKFVEDCTSLETLRECLTPAYAAPEQWLGQRPASATDVYALGVHCLCGVDWSDTVLGIAG
jgi:serine/threonine protein kinase